MTRPHSLRLAVAVGLSALTAAACSSSGSGQDGQAESLPPTPLDTGLSTADVQDNLTPPSLAQSPPSEPPAGILAHAPGALMDVSSDGTAFLTRLDDGECFFVVGSDDPEGCVLDGHPSRALLSCADRFTLSEDGSTAAFVSFPTATISLFDLRTGEAGAAMDSQSRSELDVDGNQLLPTDYEPAWLEPNKSLIFQSKLGPHVSLQVMDLESLSITNVVELPTGENQAGKQVRRLDTGPPLVVDPQTAFFAGNGALFKLDLSVSKPEIVEIVDFSASYAGAGTNVVPSGDLYPMALLEDNQMLMADRLMEQAFSDVRGVTSGAYVLDMSSGALAPLFETSTDADPWHGPTRIWISPDQTRIVVAWSDPTRLSPSRGLQLTNLSLLDFQAATLPVNPRDLPIVWAPGNDHSAVRFWNSLRFPGTWTTEDTIGFGTFSGYSIIVPIPS